MDSQMTLQRSEKQEINFYVSICAKQMKNLRTSSKNTQTQTQTLSIMNNLFKIVTMRHLPPHDKLVKQVVGDFVPMSLKELVHILCSWIRRQCSLLKSMSNGGPNLWRCCFSLACCTSVIIIDI